MTELNAKEQERAEQVFLEDHYTSVADFFEKTWQEPSATEQYAYRVYLTQRAANLNELFFIRKTSDVSEYRKEQLDVLRGKTFVTGSGILCHVSELAEYYLQNNTFPKILFCDFILMSGRVFAEAVFTLAKAIAEELDASRQETRVIWVRLLVSASFIAYIECENDSRLRKTICNPQYLPVCVKKGHADECYKLWQNSAASIVYSEIVQNGGFFPTFWIAQDDYDKISKTLRNDARGKWTRQSWRYWQKTCVTWQRSHWDDDSQLCVQEAVRCSLCHDRKAYAVAPFVFWLPESDDAIDILSTNLAAKLRATYDAAFAPMIDILTSQNSFLPGIKLKLILAVSAILSFLAFLDDAGAGNMNFKADISKISGWFGGIADIAPAFYGIITNHGLLKELNLLLFPFMASHSAPMRGNCNSEASSDLERRDQFIFKFIEALAGMETQWQKIEMYRLEHNIEYGVDSAFANRENYLRQILSSFPTDFRMTSFTFGALLTLLFWDIAELSVRGTNDYGSTPMQDWSLYLETGSGAQIAKAMHMLRFIPALAHVKKVCDRELYSPRNMIRNFGERLETRHGIQDAQVFLPEFFDWCKENNRAVLDWQKLSPIWLDQPDLEREIRCLQEWDGRGWPGYVCAGRMDMNDYLRFEEQQRAQLAGYARQHMGV